jgi:hypothetical protein
VARHGWLLLGLAGVVAIGTFFRFYELGDIPSDPTSDHAEKLLDVYDLQNGEGPVFFIRNTGREPAQFYVTYALMKGLGLSLSFETLKIGTALIGVLAIPAVFLFASEVAGRVTGLFAATLFAIGTWPIGMARSGLRFGYTPLAAAFALWFLFRYMRRRDRRDALACGVAIGLGLHGYTSFRVVPILVLLLVGLSSLYLRKAWRDRLWTVVADAGLILATAVVACVPLARYTIEHADSVFFRARTRVVDSASWPDVLGTFVENTWNALLAFNWRGDGAWVNAVPFAPLLDVVTGAALLACLAIVGYELVSHRSLTAAAIVVAAPILMLPSILSLAFPAENPGVNRLGSATPIVFTVAALPFGSRSVSSAGRKRPVAIGFPVTTRGSHRRAWAARRGDDDRRCSKLRPVLPRVRSAVPGFRPQHLRDRGGGALGRPRRSAARRHVPARVQPLGRRAQRRIRASVSLGGTNTTTSSPRSRFRDETGGSRPCSYSTRLITAGGAELMDALPGGRYLVVTSDVPGHDIALYSVPGR